MDKFNDYNILMFFFHVVKSRFLPDFGIKRRGELMVQTMVVLRDTRAQNIEK